MAANTHMCTHAHTFWSWGSVRLVTVVLLQKMRYGVGDRRWLASGTGSTHTQTHMLTYEHTHTHTLPLLRISTPSSQCR